MFRITLFIGHMVILYHAFGKSTRKHIDEQTVFLLYLHFLILWIRQGGMRQPAHIFCMSE